jgi:hypothetical protein
MFFSDRLEHLQEVRVMDPSLLQEGHVMDLTWLREGL